MLVHDKFCATQTLFLLQMDLDLNKVRVKLALSKDSSLVKLPPSEAAFRQHILRVAFQVYVWTHANEAKPPPRSPLEGILLYFV
jgi:hypothetical protein